MGRITVCPTGASPISLLISLVRLNFYSSGTVYGDQALRQLVHTVSVGTLDSALVQPRETFQPLIRHLCAAAIVVHNHTSGDPAPSAEELALTKRLAEAGRFCKFRCSTM